MGPRPAEPKFRRRASGESYICPDEVGAYIGLGASELVKRRFGGRAGPSCFFLYEVAPKLAQRFFYKFDGRINTYFYGVSKNKKVNSSSKFK